MTKDEAKVLETDMNIFPIITAQEKNLGNVLSEQLSSKNVVEVETTKIDIKARFARLKKSLRKRSASIL
jgi:hemerythrin-like domain-containing protein